VELVEPRGDLGIGEPGSWAPATVVTAAADVVVVVVVSCGVSTTAAAVVLDVLAIG